MAILEYVIKGMRVKVAILEYGIKGMKVKVVITEYGIKGTNVWAQMLQYGMKGLGDGVPISAHCTKMEKAGCRSCERGGALRVLGRS